jgi:HSP20 family protein
MLPIFRIAKPALADEFLKASFFNDFFDNDYRYSTPSVNLAETKDDFRIEVAAPGLDKNDFKINLENNVLTISSEKETKKEESENTYTRREFNYSSFKRSFTLPESVNSEQISAEHKNGILYVQIPKREEAKVKPPRQIAIA